MTLVVWLLGASAAIELALFGVRALWRARGVFLPLSVAITAFASGVLVVRWPNVLSVLIALVSSYRIFNGLRVVERRMHEQYLAQATRRTSFRLIGLQVAVAGLWLAWQRLELTARPLWLILAAIQLFGAVAVLISTIRRLKKTMPLSPRGHYSDAQLPSITVAIPARNETEELQECLKTILANNYPKLEVIVLDDCSQLKRTPEIIRAFAHDGVRFVQGQEPAPTWLPKNQAYHRLAEEASGEYILFSGVDVRFEPDTLRKLATIMLSRHKTMVSVLPQRVATTGNQLALVQAMRYWWELALPRRLFRRPPVLSSCWIVSKQALKHAGGFEAARRSIVPEAYLARQFIRQDGYSFLRSGTVLGVTTSKPVRDQRETAVRMRYPQLHRRPEAVLLAACAEFALWLLPFVLAVGGFWWHIGFGAHLLSALAAALLILAYELIAFTTRLNPWWFGLLSFPAVVMADLGLLHYSMWKYEFSEVIWKARNICIPAMHVIPHLPKLR